MGQAKRKRLPTVAVVIATIPPREKLLERALASVSAQTRPPDEVIVITDTEGEGAGPTRNKGWQQASSDFIAILDDDDEFLPTHLESLMTAASRMRADVVYPWFDHIGWPEWTTERPDPLAVPFNGNLVHPFGIAFGPEQARHMRTHAFIPATILVRRLMLERVSGYPAPYTPEWEERGGCEDWALLIRLFDAGAKFYHHPERTWRLNHGAGTAGAPWNRETPLDEVV